MKQFKIRLRKILSATITAGMLLSIIGSTVGSAWLPESYDKVTPLKRGSDVVARFVVASDAHVGNNFGDEKLTSAYEFIGKLGGADALILAGDLTNTGEDGQYDTLMKVVSENTKELTVERDGFTLSGAGAAAPVKTTILSMGNHEFHTNVSKATDLFMEKTGQNPDGLYWIEDKVPLIKLSVNDKVDDHDYTSPEGEFLKDSYDGLKGWLEEIDRSGYKGHIFLITHIPHPTGFDERMTELMQKYPQLIVVTGHTHDSPFTPKFIDQSKGFTEINDGTVGAYYRDNINGSVLIQSEHNGSSAVMFDVMSDNTTRVYRLDIEHGKIAFEDEEFILDASDTAEDFKYLSTPTATSYGSNAAAPYFVKGDDITIRDMGNYSAAELTFPKATTKTKYNYDSVAGYYVKAIPADGNGDTISLTVADDKSDLDYMKVAFHGLEWDTEYRFEVTAVNHYGMTSAEPLKSSGKINVGTRPVNRDTKLLYNIDPSIGVYDDIMGHASDFDTKFFSVDYDETIGKTVLTTKGFSTQRYAFGMDEFSQIQYGCTIETYVNVRRLLDTQEIFGNSQFTSISFGIQDGETYVRLNTMLEGTQTICNAPVNYNEWVHMTVTYDSRDVRVYLNGELAATGKAAGGLEVPFDDTSLPEYYFFDLGGRRRGAFEHFRMASSSKIAYFRVYSGVMDDAAVKSAYEGRNDSLNTFAFTDVKSGDWFYQNTLYAYANSLMNGTSSTTFSPTANTSRAMIVQLLYNMEGRPEVTYKPIFTDVKEDAWYADAVIWAYENGVTTGSSATTFSPDALVTREQVAVFLYRYMKDYKGEEMAAGAELSAFPDSGKISPYAGFAEAVSWANGVGIITGKSAGGNVTLAPLDSAQRCETATMFARFHKNFVL
ncbi:MAG: S-layer homology domain-containing protein [Clostridia bacterium]|nr:S-layer homology domain-containing protein [Clostridia bacterium]